ncbi:glycosyltransferase family 2 protein [Pseudonocardia sp. RS010]|uniref:glycosyltransferase family 2 protein n=1 Tax=Pseudonocardia sp. RS010 TaxID=3385979 RepID=UPI0039A0D626
MHGPGTARARVSVVVPTRNERRNVEHLLAGLHPSHEVVLSDGGSVDGTVEAARLARPDCRVVAQGWNRGSSLLAGLHAARGDVLVMLDADGSTCPSEVPRMVAAITDGADVVRSARATRRSPSETALAAVASACLAATVTDPWCGTTALRRSVVPRLGLPDLTRHATEFELLLVARAAAEGLAVREVPDVRAAPWHRPGPRPSVAETIRMLRTLRAERRSDRAHPVVPLPRTSVEGIADRS